jgi:uncharacterized integral membrane protein
MSESHPLESPHDSVEVRFGARRGGIVPAAGQIVNDSRLVTEPPHVVSQAVIAATAGATDYTVSAPGPGSIVLTRQYRPTWTIVVAIVGFLFFLIGLLALLVKNTEALTLTLTPEEVGTRVTMSGVATPEMVTRLAAALGGTAGLERDPYALRNADGEQTKVCPSCAETVKAAATVCRFCKHSFEDLPAAPAT